MAGPIQFIFGTLMHLYEKQLPNYSEFRNFNFWENNSIFCDFGLCMSFRSWISEMAGPIQFIFGMQMDLYE